MESATHPPTSTCPECGAQVERKESRLVCHTVAVRPRELATCPGSGNAVALSHSEGRLVAVILEAMAQERGLDWAIEYRKDPEEPAQLSAFRLVRDRGQLVAPAEVIGETEDDARACITLAAWKATSRRSATLGRPR